MTDEQQRLERKIARLERSIEAKTMTPSERQAASLGVRPAKPESDADAGDASKRQAARLLGDG